MRMRKKKHGGERLALCSDYIVKTSAELEKKPFALEIGCGKGGFIAQLAAREPERQFLAMECQPGALVLAAERVKSLGLSNVKLMYGDAEKLGDFIGDGEAETIYLNFSDPWPKQKHYKRRLTYRDFLLRYKKALAPGGRIIFKTDNLKLFEFSLREFTACGFALEGLTRDLHGSEYNAGNIMTEYEKNFSEKGFKINRVIAIPLPDAAISGDADDTAEISDIAAADKSAENHGGTCKRY